jgi:Flp pilus assembly protein TadG
MRAFIQILPNFFKSSQSRFAILIWDRYAALPLGDSMLKYVMARLRRARRKYADSEHGATAVEFAMVAGPFFLVLGVIIETGLMMFTEYALQSAVQDTGRLIRTGQAQNSGFSATTFKNAICDTAGVLIDCQNKVTVYVNHSAQTFAQLSALVPSFLTIGPTVSNTTYPVTFSCGAPLQPVAVVATYDWYFSMVGMSYLGNVMSNSARRLVGFAIFLNEPFNATGTC